MVFAVAVILPPVLVRGQSNLFVADWSGEAVDEITPGGSRSTFYQFTPASGTLDSPEGVAFDGKGDLFVSVDNGTEDSDGAIYKFINNNGVLSTNPTLFASGLMSPQGLVFDAAGNLLVADVGNGGDGANNSVIDKFTPSGTRSTFASGLTGPIGLAFDSAGDLFASDGNNIDEFTLAGTQSTFATGLGEPYGLAFDSTGNLYVANFSNSTIYKFTPGGTRSTFFPAGGPLGPEGPHGLAFNTAGDLFVASSSYPYTEVDEISPGGSLSVFAFGFGGPAFLAFEDIPEPSTWAMVAMGAIALLSLRRRK